MKRWIAGLAAWCIAPLAYAGEITAQVEGMVCVSCAQGIEHALKERDEVAAVKIDVEAHRVQITTRPDTDLSDDDLRAIIDEAGFEVSKITRE